jgi:hypothetical protein
MKFKTVIVGLAVALAGVAAQVDAQTLPPIAAYDLNKKPISWPAGLPAERTILIIAFTRGQQNNVDSWVRGMALKSPGAPAWFEVPMISNPGGIARFFIDNGMRGGIPNVQDRARVVTVYTNKAAMMTAMGLPNETQVHVLVVTRMGKILVRVSGDHSPAGEAAIRQALRGS